MNRRTLLPTYLILALCATGPLHAQAHAPGPCHTGELWTTAFPGLSPGAFVHIPAGVTIVLNTATVDLGGLFVEGRLVFDHTVPGDTVHLNTAYAVVTGSLQIGCKDATGTITRFTKKTSITLIAPERYGGAALFPADAGVNWHATIAAAFPHPGGVAADNEVYQAALDRGLAIVGSNVADQGELRIYGNSSRLQGWTTLAATAAAGNLIVGLNAALAGPWKVGDELAIASSDFEYADQIADGSMIGANKMGGHLAGYVQGEERTIAAIGATASELVLNLPLTHGHWSAAVSAPFPSGVQSVPEQTEVANLTRSVVIRGEISAFSGSQRAQRFAGDPVGTRHAGHVILMKHPDTSANPYCEVDWAEFENLGVEGKLGRYPFHWHMLDDARRAGQRPFLEDCSVHHCFNRFVTIHHSSNVDVERNVGYDTLGSGFFLEDSTETGVPVGNSVQGVRLVGNLGMKVGRPSGFVLGYPALYQDLDLVDPSVYWIQHPNQVVEDNHAAGAAGHGFYLAPNDLADGFSHPASGASSFKNNVAHSNGQHGFYHQTRVQWGWQTGDAPAGEGLIAWKNRRYGIWWRTYGTSLLEGCAVADNKSGIYPASEGRQNAHDGAAPATCRLTIRDAVIFGETPNLGEIAAGNPAEVAAQRSLPQTYWNFQRPENLASPHESPWDTLNGLEAYDGRNLFEDLKLAWFPDARTLPDPNGGGGAAQLQVVAGLTQVEYNSKFAEDPRNSVAGLEFVASGPERVFHPVRYRATAAGQAHSMVRNTVVYDEDGSLGYGADVYLCYLDDFFEANATAVGTRDFGRNLLILPTAAVDFAQFEVHTNLVGTTPMDVSVAHQTLGPVGLRVGQMSGSATKDFFFNAPIGLDSNPNTLREGVYSCTFPNATAIPTQYTIKIQFAEAAGLPTIIGVPLLNLDPIKRVKLNNSLITNTEPSLNALLGSIHENVYFHDSVNSILYVRTTSIVLGPSGSADLDGTRNILTINL